MKTAPSGDLSSGQQPPFDLQDEPLRGVSRRVIKVLVALWLIVGVVLLIRYWLPGEIARWHDAAAEEHRQQGDVEAAMADVEKGLQWDPDSASLYTRRALVRINQGRYDEAVEDAGRALELQPGYVEAHRVRAQAWQQLSQYRRAIQDLNRILELKPNSAETIYLRAQVWQKLGQHDRAIEDWQALAQRTSGSAKANMLNALAYSRALAGQGLEQGLKEVNQALETDADNAAFLDTRGFLHYQAGDYQAALEDLDRAVQQVEQWLDNAKRRSGPAVQREVAESVAVIRYHRGLVNEELGHDEQAGRDFARVRQLGFEPTPDLF